jgi:hypothetical protein
MVKSHGRRLLVVGIVADEVSAVHVGNVSATMGRNAFLAAVSADARRNVVVTTADGDREAG